MTVASPKRVFISHASADEEFVSAFVNSILNVGAGLRAEDIFYSSAADTGVKSGEYLMERVREEAGASLLVIALITPTYQTRPVCIAELGAAWARDVLLPVMAPGMNRSDLEGVLPGLMIKSLDDEEALAEIDQRLEDLGYPVPSTSALVGRRAWKRSLSKGLSPAALPATLTSAQQKKMQRDLEDSQNAVKQLRRDLEEQIRRNDKLSQAKTFAEVREADLPTDERERFDQLRGQAQEAIRGLGKAVVEALWHQISGKEMLLPDRMDEPRMHDRILAEEKDGRLNFDEDTGEVSLNTDFPDVSDAADAVGALDEFLAEARSEDFHTWFRAEFSAPVDLHKKGCWDAVL